MRQSLFIGCVLLCFPSASVYAQSMGQMLQPEHPAAARAVPLVRALLAGDVEGALAQGRENATAAFIDGGMEDAVRRLAVDLRDSGPYDVGSMLLAASVGVIIELRQTDGGESSALLLTMEAEPSYRITGIRQVQMRMGPGAPPAAGGAAGAPPPAERAAPALAYNGEMFEIHAAPGIEVEGARRDLYFAVETWRRYFGEAPPRIAVVMFENTADAATHDFTPLRNRGMPTLPWTEGLVDLSGKRALPHEACHMFFQAYARQRGAGGGARPADAPRAYGVATVADWFDEAIATLCEYPEMQAGRLAHLARHWEERIPLGELLAMEHPTMPLVRAAGLTPAAGGTTLTQLTAQGGDNAALLHRSALFYSQVLGLALFLSEQHGPRYIRDLADRLTTADDPAHMLFASAELAALEKAWADWLTSSTR